LPPHTTISLPATIARLAPVFMQRIGVFVLVGVGAV
jgi:hypothetical protein